MNPAFRRVLAASPEDRRGLFVAAAQRLGTTERYVEKDFWVCWTLDALFNERRSADDPRLLFKGGTSLSKAFGLIARFSEDIDITVFREDIGQPESCGDLEQLSGKKRGARLDAIRDACRSFIARKLRSDLSTILAAALEDAGLPARSATVELDGSDPDGQTLLLSHASAIEVPDGYVKPVVRIECGAKSALDPHASAIVKPYVADDLPGSDFAVANVTTVDARRTFWDKVVILHGTRRWFDARGELRQQGERVSRHYYDVHRLLDSEVGRDAAGDLAMAKDCARHARMFFDRPAFDLLSAVEGRFAVAPAPSMIDALPAGLREHGWDDLRSRPAVRGGRRVHRWPRCPPERPRVDRRGSEAERFRRGSGTSTAAAGARPTSTRSRASTYYPRSASCRSAR